MVILTTPPIDTDHDMVAIMVFFFKSKMFNVGLERSPRARSKIQMHEPVSTYISSQTINTLQAGGLVDGADKTQPCRETSLQFENALSSCCKRQNHLRMPAGHPEVAE